MHGYLSSRKSFLGQLEFFGRDFNVFAPDLKGFGDNTGMEYPYSLCDYLDEVKEYMYKNSLVSPDVVAHSFGGRIAILGASSDRSLFNKLVLTGSAGLKSRFSLKREGKKLAFNVLKKFVPKEKLKKFYSSDYNSLSPVMRESFIKIVSFYLDDYVPKITNPTLIINGKKDRETPPYTAKKLHGLIPDSKLQFIEGAGHFCFLDCPNNFNFSVKEFLLYDT